jgi:ABC-type antimicrobial peptide transport system permease subunit
VILKNLFRRKGRTLLTVLGISIGVATIISLGALANGLDAGYNAMLSGSQADLVLSQPQSMDIAYSVVDEAVAQELEAMPEVDRVSGMLQGYVQTEGTPYFFVFGYSADSFVLERFQIIEGISLNDRELRRLRGKPVLLGSAAAESMDKKVGDALRVSGSAYRVAGIYQTGDAFEDSGAVFEMEEAQELLGKPRQVSLFYIQLKDGASTERLQQRVARRWSDLEISSTTDFADKQILGESMRIFVWVIAGLAIILGGVGMMNAQLMSVYERTREIGVLRAVGWRKDRVLRMILSESIVVCLLGGLLGLAFGWFAVQALSRSSMSFGTSSADITLGLVLEALIVVLILGLSGGIYPARRAARLQPIEALRYEGGSGGQALHRLPVGGMAVQSLWQRSTRTLLTLTVIALTVGSIMALDSITQGMMEDFGKMAIGADAEIMLRQADVADTSLSAIDERIGDKVAAMPEVEHVSGMLMTAVMLENPAGFFIIQGYSPNEYAIRRLNIVEGEPLATNHQVIVGKAIAASLKKKVGDTLVLGGTRFRIVGIYESGGGWEELGGVITLRDAQTFTGRPRKVTLYFVKVRDPQQAQAVMDHINREYPDVHAALSGEFVEQMPDMQAMNAMMGGISFLAVVVGGLGVMNTMLMAVLERTREIGVLRAVGWRRRAVLGMILREALLLSIIGGVGGVLIAFGLVSGLMAVPSIGEALRAVWTADVFGRALLVALLLGLLGGLYPAYRATRLQPIEALRYE